MSKCALAALLAAACAEEPAEAPPDPWADARARMVRVQIWGRGVRDRAVVRAMRTVPRHRFAPAELRAHAYEDRPLPLAHGQAVSQPYMVAFLAGQLAVQPGEKVLEVGCGNGYQLAVLAELTPRVFGVDPHRDLVAAAKELLGDRAHVRVGGEAGWPERAPFDAILVTAALPELPGALLAQLAPDGRLLAPVGPVDGPQHLVLTRRDGTRKILGAARFGPLRVGLGG